MADEAHSAALLGGFCVTGSVAVGTPRDVQDATGHESGNAPYLASGADFIGNFASSPIRPIRLHDHRHRPLGIPPRRNVA